MKTTKRPLESRDARLAPSPRDAIGHFILASSSPRRRELLGAAGLSFTVVSPRVEEEAVEGETPSGIALRLAKTKAQSVAAAVESSAVLAADTVVACGGKIFGKPKDEGVQAVSLPRITRSW